MTVPTNRVRDGSTVWDGVIAAATTRVVHYLATSSQPFDPSTLLAQSMLSFLDHYTLRELIKERNGNRLCGLLGCASVLTLYDDANGDDYTHATHTPQDTPAAQSNVYSGAMQHSAPCRPQQQQQSPRCHCRLSSATRDTRAKALVVPEVSDSFEEEANDDDIEQDTPPSASAARGEVTHDGGTNEACEIVYHDDMYTEESFRLARRHAHRLRRLREREQKRRNAGRRASSSIVKRTASVSAQQTCRGKEGGTYDASTPSTPLSLHSVSGVCRAHFCSAECADIFDAEVWPRVSRYVLLQSDTVVQALASLFPKLPVHLLEQLARQDVSTALHHDGSDGKGGGVVVLVGAVKERRESADAVPSNEDDREYHAAEAEKTTNEHCQRREERQTHTNSPLPSHNPSSRTTLREVLDKMHVLHRVWAAETVARFPSRSTTRWGGYSVRQSGDAEDGAMRTENVAHEEDTGDGVTGKGSDCDAHHCRTAHDTSKSSNGKSSQENDGTPHSVIDEDTCDREERCSPDECDDVELCRADVWATESTKEAAAVGHGGGLRGALLVMDYCMHMSSACMRNLMLARYLCHRRDIRALLRQHGTTEGLLLGTPQSSSNDTSPPHTACSSTYAVLMRVMGDTLHALERRAQRLHGQHSIKLTVAHVHTDVCSSSRAHVHTDGRRALRADAQVDNGVCKNNPTSPTQLSAVAPHARAAPVCDDTLDEDDDSVAVTRALAVAALTRAQRASEERRRACAAPQRARRELLLTHLFSPTTATTLSRVLRCDYSFLLNEAWSTVWGGCLHLDGPSYSSKRCSGSPCSGSRAAPLVDAAMMIPMSCLSFPAAVPAALLRPASVSPEVVMLGMVFLLGAACVSAPVLRHVLYTEGRLGNGGGGGIALTEVMDVIDVTEDDLRMAVLTLLCGDEDEEE